jgi:hypothetical protein
LKSTKVIDRGWNRILRDAKRIQGSYVKIGILSDAGQYDPAEGSENLADVATTNEFGSADGKVPSRPFMRQTFDRKIGDLKSFIESLKKSIWTGRLSVRQSLGQLGEKHVGHIKRAIKNREFLENAPATIARKGSDTPLIDTGRLWQSLTYEIHLK